MVFQSLNSTLHFVRRKTTCLQSCLGQDLFSFLIPSMSHEELGRLVDDDDVYDESDDLKGCCKYLDFKIVLKVVKDKRKQHRSCRPTVSRDGSNSCPNLWSHPFREENIRVEEPTISSDS